MTAVTARASFVLLAVAVTMWPAYGVAQTPELVSVNHFGSNSGNHLSGSITAGRSPNLSDDGRYVVFESRASDLVTKSDTADSLDIFVRDMATNQTELVSVDHTGTTAVSGSWPMISSDGRWVVFVSGSGAMPPGYTSTATSDIFVRSLAAGTTTLVSKAHDSNSGGNGASSDPIISKDGNWVLFFSEATNLVDLPDNNGQDDLFAWNRGTGTITLVSINAAGTAAACSQYGGVHSPVISEGTSSSIRVAFTSSCTDLTSGDVNGQTDVVSRILPGGAATNLTATANSFSGSAVISADSGWVAFASAASNLTSNDLNGTTDCFLSDGAGIILISKNADGTQSGNDRSGCQAINGDRGFVTFTSYASDLVANDTNNDEDVFIRDVRPEVTSLVSANAAGTDSGDSGSGAFAYSSISRNGRFVVFDSWATNLEGVNADAGLDVYVRDHCMGVTYLMDPAIGGGSGNFESAPAMISGNGRYVVYASNATNLVSLDQNGRTDVFFAEVPNWGDWDCGSLAIFADGFESGNTSKWSAVN